MICIHIKKDFDLSGNYERERAVSVFVLSQNFSSSPAPVRLPYRGGRSREENNRIISHGVSTVVPAGSGVPPA